MSKKTSAMLIVITIVATLIAVEVLSLHTSVLTNSGYILSNINVYQSDNATSILRAINWAPMSPGSFSEYTVFIENNKESVMTMTLRTDGWLPWGVGDYFGLDWNYTEGVYIPAFTKIPVKLTLSVSSSIHDITDYSFNIIITGMWED